MYQIRDWDQNFENHKSRTIDRCSWIGMPNKMGLGLRRLLGMPTGSTAFGIFILVAEKCSHQRMPRKGFLSDDGRKDGSEWSISDISALILRPEEEISKAFECLCHPSVNFIINHDLVVPSQRPPSALAAPSQRPPSALYEGRKEGRERSKKEVGSKKENINTPLRPPRGADRSARRNGKTPTLRSAMHAIGIRIRGDVPSPILPTDFATLVKKGYVRAVAGIGVHGFGGQNATFVIIKNEAGEDKKIPTELLTPENIEIGAPE